MSPLYTDWLKKIIAVVTAYPTLWPLVQAWLAATTALVDAVKAAAGIAPPDTGLQMVSFDADAVTLETELAQLVVNPAGNALLDPQVLRGAWFVAKHMPEIAAALQAIFKLAGK